MTRVNFSLKDTIQLSGSQAQTVGGDSGDTGVITFKGKYGADDQTGFSNPPSLLAWEGVANGDDIAAEDITAKNLTLTEDCVVTGGLTVNGTTTTVNSTTVTVDDPIFTIGGDSDPSSDDNKDRGIEFRYHNGSAPKLGFFGYDDSHDAFTFIPDATNTSEVFSGPVGTIRANLTSTGTSTFTTVDINGGAIDGTAIGATTAGTGAFTTLSTSGNTTIGGDLTVTGDDLTMGTNTDTALLIADGTNFNPVVPSGDISVTNAGVFSISAGVIVDADVNSSAAIAMSKTAFVAGTNCTLATNTLNIDDAFLVNDGDDTTSGVITAAGYKLNKADASGDVIIEFQQGGTTTYTMGIDDSDSNLFKIHSHTSLEDTSDFKIDGSGNVTIGGDLTVTGDDLTMGTNTDTALLIADGTNFNPVVPSGDISVTNAGVFSISAGVIVDADVNSSAAISMSKTAFVAGTNCTLSDNTLNIDDAFLKNDADDSTTGTITAAGYKLNKNAESGDVTIDFQQGGTTKYTLGIDDSDSDLFKIHSHTSLEDTSDFKIDGSGNVTIGGTLGVTGAITGDVTSDTVDINGGAIDGTAIGANSASTGAFTTLSTTSSLTINGDIDVNAGAFTVASSSGNTTIGGTLGVTGAITGDVTGDVTGNVTGNVIFGTNASSTNVTLSQKGTGSAADKGTITLVGCNDGGLTCDGDIIAFSSSDRRLKDNIKSIENPLEKVKTIGGYTYTWNELGGAHSIHGSGDTDVGVIAQEVEKIIPEAVTDRDTGYKAVQYDKLIPLLVECVKEQQDMIEKLRNDINVLKN